MGDVVQFPSRARPRGVLSINPAGEVYSWKDKHGFWLVDWLSASGDSACILGSFATEAEADVYVARWNREHPLDPGGAA